MAFAILTEATDNPDPYEMGEIRLIDPVLGRSSDPVPRGQRYMVFIEIVTMLDFLIMASTNNRRASYTVSDGSTITYDPEKRTATFSFRGLNLAQDVERSIDEVKAGIRDALVQLSHVKNSDEAVLADLRAALQ